LLTYLSTNNLLNSFQSAYIKHHSTETTLLSIHEHVIESMSHQQVTCLTLLDLSAAFDNIEHSILERHPSWFAISSALSWIKSIKKTFFFVNIENSKSSAFQLLYGVHQGSVLGTLLFILYTTLISTIISDSAAKTITSMLMILNCSYHSQLWISLITSLRPKKILVLPANW